MRCCIVESLSFGLAPVTPIEADDKQTKSLRFKWHPVFFFFFFFVSIAVRFSVVCGSIFDITALFVFFSPDKRFLETSHFKYFPETSICQIFHVLACEHDKRWGHKSENTQKKHKKTSKQTDRQTTAVSAILGPFSHIFEGTRTQIQTNPLTHHLFVWGYRRDAAGSTE